jgi:protein-tyrosine-phosphatase
VGLEQGLDLSHHSARLLTRELVTGADHVLGMSQHHVDRAAALGAGPKARLLGAFAGRDTTEAEVPDPYGGGLEEYRATYAQLEGLLREAVRRIASERGSGGGHG